jgi:hypothetical protein
MVRINQTRQWQKRQRDKGIEPNADALWAYIKNRWSNNQEYELEVIFQAIK